METVRASELRIGNFVMDRGGKILFIDHWEYENKISEKRVDGLHPFTEFVEYLQPIPLTEEWLLKFGFEMEYSQLTNIYKYFLVNAPFGYSQGQFNVFTQTGCFSVEIKYVHQLQNLYFALTNEELEINN